MEFEVLKRSHLKRNILIGVLVVGIIVAIILNFTRAKYRVTESIPLVNGTINYSPGDIIISAYFNDELLETFPTKDDGYTISNITCDNNAIATLNEETWEIEVTNLVAKGTRCDVYFEERASAKDIILSEKIISDERSGDIIGVLTEDTTGIIYSVEDDWGISYVFAGAPTDNWLYFAGYYWRIIRINGDGSVRLIYNGTTTNQLGEGTQIGTSAFNIETEDNAYVGYMYGTPNSNTYNATHTNIHDSTIKQKLDYWYETELLNYEENISLEMGFCNDRKVVPWDSNYTTLGYGNNNTVYAATDRVNSPNTDTLDVIQTPTLKCSQENDLFTLKESSKGNRDLKYPIGLITMDEAIVAGGRVGVINNQYYLYNGEMYWTMTPGEYYNIQNWYGVARIIYISDFIGGDASSDFESSGVRPVINLRADVTLTGSGTTSDPYRVEGA